MLSTHCLSVEPGPLTLITGSAVPLFPCSCLRWKCFERWLKLEAWMCCFEDKYTISGRRINIILGFFSRRVVVVVQSIYTLLYESLLRSLAIGVANTLN